MILRTYSVIPNKRDGPNRRDVTKKGILQSRFFIYCYLLHNKGVMDGNFSHKQINVQHVY